MSEIGATRNNVNIFPVSPKPISQPIKNPENHTHKTENKTNEHKDSNNSVKHKSHETQPSSVSFDNKTKTTELKKGDKWQNGTVISTNVKATTYSPDPDSAMEGGDSAKFSKESLSKHTLEKYIKDPKKAGFVAIAIDEHMIKEGKIKPGDEIRIPELEKKFNKSPIIFKAIDTGAAFTGGHYDSKGGFHASKKYHAKGLTGFDICTDVGGKIFGNSFSNVTMVKVDK